MRYRCSEIFECFHRLMYCKFDAGFGILRAMEVVGAFGIAQGERVMECLRGELQGMELVGGSL